MQNPGLGNLRLIQHECRYFEWDQGKRIRILDNPLSGWEDYMERLERILANIHMGSYQSKLLEHVQNNFYGMAITFLFIAFNLMLLKRICLHGQFDFITYV